MISIFWKILFVVLLVFALLIWNWKGVLCNILSNHPCHHLKRASSSLYFIEVDHIIIIYKILFIVCDDIMKQYYNIIFLCISWKEKSFLISIWISLLHCKWIGIAETLTLVQQAHIYKWTVSVFKAVNVFEVCW